MKYSRAEHKRFLDLELKSIAEKYCEVLNTKASILKENNEIYATLCVRISNEETNGGQLLLKFKKANGIPRKNEYFTAVILPLEICKPKTWGTLSWGDLRKRQIEFSEVHCIWQGKEGEDGTLICGFKGLSIEMAEYLRNNPGCVVILGPQEPPIGYYQNLIDIVGMTSSSKVGEILDFDIVPSCWSPTPIHKDFTSDSLLQALEYESKLIVQGPPGTGKTYRIAQMVATLLCKGKSVLVTSLTNRALMEVAEKDSLKNLLHSGKIFKTALTSDEIAQLPGLQGVDCKRIPSFNGCLTLATFYISSSWAKADYSEEPFDYVIMDEASQALLAMIAGIGRLGRKILWIGDQNQLPPVTNINQDIIVKKDYVDLAHGFATLCNNLPYKSFVLSDTFRLQKHTAELTSIFYSTPLISCFDVERIIPLPNVMKDGGCVSYKSFEFEVGDKCLENESDEILSIVHQILANTPKAKIAVISKFRATVRSLQKQFLFRFGNKDNVLIDTVERIQGLTTDFCLFVIPNVMRNLSLNKELFNVATSRAEQATIIIGPPDILSTNCDESVRTYLTAVIENHAHISDSGCDDNSTISIPTDSASTHGIGVKVVGKIDLSRFERPKKELSKTKKNYYIIDTNVFVNCPDIISKIDAKYTIVLSAKVVDELDKMKIKLSESEKRNAEKALRLLNQESRQNIIYEVADVSLLPADFDKRSPDNMILSVALKYKDENPIMLTSDNGLQLKSKILGIATVSLKTFLKR